MTPDENPGAIALDCELDSLRVFLGRGDLAPLAHQLQHLRQDRSRLARLFVESDRLASRVALVLRARTLFIAHRGLDATLRADI